MKNQLMLTVRTKARLYLPWMAAMIIGAIVTAGGLIAFFHYRDATPEWSIAGLLLAVIPDAVFGLPWVVIEASRSAGLTATGLAEALVHYAIRIGLDCLVGAAVAWFGSLVTVKHRRAPAR